MYVTTLCIEKKLIDENRELLLALNSKKTILSCNSSIYEDSDVSEIAYVLNSGNEIVAYLNELRERRVKLKQVVFIHSDENLLRQANKAGFYTIGIGIHFAYTKKSYERIEEMLEEAMEQRRLKQKRQNVFLVIAVVLFIAAIMLQNDPMLFSMGIIGSLVALIITIGVYPEKSFWRIISFFLDGIM